MPCSYSKTISREPSQVPSENGILMALMQPKKILKVKSKQQSLAQTTQEASMKYAKLPLQLQRKGKEQVASTTLK